MQFLHTVASQANILRASSRVGEERCNKALRTLHGGEAIHCTYCSLDSIQLLFRKMPEPAFTPSPPPPTSPSKGVLLSGRIKDRTREMAGIEPILPKFLRVLNGKNCLTMKRFLKGCL